MHETEAQIKYVKEPLKDSVLHLAARRRDNELMKLFIEAGATVDLPNVCYTVLPLTQYATPHMKHRM